MRNFIRYQTLIPTIMISALSSGAIVSTIIVPTYAMQAPGNQNSAKISYDDFIAKMGDVLTQKRRMPRANQKQEIQDLFSKFNFVNNQNKGLIVNSIISKKTDGLIVREQAEALMTYIDNKLDIRKMAAPLGNKVDLLNWTKRIANVINIYFSKPYPIGNSYVINCNEGNVLRPNHGLAHGVRQGLLALDIVDALNNSKIASNDQDIVRLINWVRKKIGTDPNFRSKVQFTAAFQRTGRESEARWDQQGPARDAQNFEESVREFTAPGGVFQNPRDVLIYKVALGGDRSGQNFSPEESEDINYLSTIFETSHWLDLRRLEYAGMTSFQHEALEHLFGYPDNQTREELMDNIIEKLWERAGEYLRASGDRDQDPNFIQTHKKYKISVFCRLSNNPSELVDTLFTARENSKVSF